MKKPACFFLALTALCLCLAGCAARAPERAADGAAWEEAWVTVGNVVGVDTPDGITHREYNDTLAANRLYYATWSIGEGVPYVNEDGDDATVYDAQIYLLLAGFDNPGKAQANTAHLLEMAREQYDIGGETTGTHNGQDFTFMTYVYSSETNPYARGVSAFGTYANCSVVVELSCTAEYAGDPADVLASFLDVCHYAE